MSIRVEAVTVCLEYDDFLEQTIRLNQSIFDDMIVVTSKEDKGTLAVCERYGIRWVHCPYFYRQGPFCKAHAINLGLAHLSQRDSWILHIDADMILPRNTRKILNNLPLDTKTIYGIDRADCPSYDEFLKYLTKTDLYEKHYFAKRYNGWDLGHRLLHFDYGGWVPVGYFQLWHTESGISRYPTVCNESAERTDVLFPLQWAPENRRLIPDLIGIHLTTAPKQMGANWNGRKTPRFGASSAETHPNIPLKGVLQATKGNEIPKA